MPPHIAAPWLVTGLLLLASTLPAATAQAAPDRQAPKVALGTYNQQTGELEGSVSDNGQVVRVEVYDGNRLVGQAQLSGTRWKIGWQPADTSQSVRVVARDAAGNSGESRTEFRRLSLQDTATLVQPALFLRLPTAAGMVTRYTLDGSTPTPLSPAYRTPLVLTPRTGQPTPLARIPTTPPTQPQAVWKPPQGEIRKATVVRTRLFRGNEPAGPVVTRTYLIGSPAPTLPVVSLATDPGNFFDPGRGIYIPGVTYDRDVPKPGKRRQGNYDGNGEAWERPVHIEWFEPGGQRGLAQDAGVRVSGKNSVVLPQKSLQLYARSGYGPTTFKYPFFGAGGPREFERLLLRTSGQDFLWTKFKDCMLHGLLRDTRLDVQACRPAVVFLNGEYWGLHNLREQNDEHYLASRHGVKAKDVVIVDGFGELEEGQEGDEAPFLALLRFADTNDLAQPGNYAQVAAQIDIDNFIDYNIFQIYTGNEDWPENNVQLWRVRPGKKPAAPAQQPYGHDGRWRWLIFDTDQSLFLPERNTLSRALGQDPKQPLQPMSTVLLRKLVANPTFKARFLSRFEMHLNQTFAPPRLLADIERFRNLLSPEMPEHVRRWNYPTSLAGWEAEVENLRYFATERPAYMRRFLQQLASQP